MFHTSDYSDEANARELRDGIREAAALACSLGAAWDLASGHNAVFDRLLSRHIDAHERERPFEIYSTCDF